MPEWQVGSTQTVWFMASVEGFPAEKLFEAVFGTEPDTSQNNKVPSPQAPFFSSASSERDGERRTIVTAPGRIDLKMEGVGENPLPSLSDDPSHFINSSVLPYALKGSAEISGATRVSNVVQLAMPMPDLATSTERAAGLVGVEYLSESSDFIFQVNRRRPFADSTRVMNRLVRVRTVAVKGLTIIMGPGGPAQLPELGASYSLQLMLDINSVPTGDEYSSEESSSLHEQICLEAVRLAASEEVFTSLKEQ